MYSKLIILACAAACVLAAPSTDVVPLEKQQPTVIPIVSQSDELEANGTYKFSYETGNGIKREEVAYEKVLPKVEGRSASSNEGGESEESNEIHVQRGSYSYTAPDGSIITLSYIADENGFQPIGDHIPRVPAPVQTAAASSSEKTGRALKAKDSAVLASEPVSAKVESKPAPSAPSAPAVPAPEAPAPAASAAAAPAPAASTAEAPASSSENPDIKTTTVELSTEPASTIAAITSTLAPTSAITTEAPTTSAPESISTNEPAPTSQSDSESSTTNAPKPTSEEESSSTTVAA